MKPKAIQLGIPRSGSTVVWQIMAHLLGRDQVIKAHPADDEFLHLAHLPKVITIRYPPDVIGSLWAVREPEQQTEFDLHEVITYAWNQFERLDRWLVEPFTTIHYEDLVSKDGIGLSRSVLQAGTFFQKIIKDKELEEIISRYSLEANRAIAETMTSFEEYDRKSLIHGRHIGAVEPGSWVGVLPLWSHGHIIKVMRKHMKRWDYL
jgi:hypothetical protein